MKFRTSYKQGVVITSSHPVLLEKQVVEIIEDNGDTYKVRVFITGKIENIEKKFVKIN